MKNGNLKIELELGNDAMRSNADVVRALKAVIEKIENGSESGKVRDVNGNTVGHFEFEKS